jgi:hypothetical protein
MRECIQHCTECHNVCVETLDHELRLGGPHAAADHVRLLLDCAQLCATSDDFMLRGSDLSGRVCGVCAEACDRCAADCERLAGDDQLIRRCAEVCRQCAACCRRMAASS